MKYHSFIFSNHLSLSGWESMESLSQEHSLWGSNSPWIWCQFIAEHHAHLKHSHVPKRQLSIFSPILSFVHHFASLLNIWFELSFREWLCTEIRKVLFSSGVLNFFSFFLSLFTFWQQALCEDCGKVSFPDEVMHPNPSFTFSVSHTPTGLGYDMTWQRSVCGWIGGD